ncbi:hypothetical protein QBC40DRAFT_260740 [Triangularia verruculosa]|uniref:Uncharacterized protein n=1 Tax=Triangularia verruculosa TaxID=2587418 RepID=A0AAN6XTJ8_9PEZI|nr:hypothetical protein QBC40DRAFT_260740 [Triangularia verruculosa]
MGLSSQPIIPACFIRQLEVAASRTTCYTSTRHGQSWGAMVSFVLNGSRKSVQHYRFSWTKIQHLVQELERCGSGSAAWRRELEAPQGVHVETEHSTSGLRLSSGSSKQAYAPPRPVPTTSSRRPRPRIHMVPPDPPFWPPLYLKTGVLREDKEKGATDALPAIYHCYDAAGKRIVGNPAEDIPAFLRRELSVFGISRLCD